MSDDASTFCGANVVAHCVASAAACQSCDDGTVSQHWDATSNPDAEALLKQVCGGTWKTDTVCSCVPQSLNKVPDCCLGNSGQNVASCVVGDTDFCPQSSTCNHTMQHYCFNTLFHGKEKCGTYPDPKNGPTTIETCPGMTSEVSVKEALGGQAVSGGGLDMTPALSNVCRTWCDANPAACNASMTTFCQEPANAGRPACSCLRPQLFKWGVLTFNGLRAVTTANPKVREQLWRDGEMDVACAWPPCHMKHNFALTPRVTSGQSQACPNPNLECLNVDVAVHVDDLAAGNVTIGACLSSAQAAAKASAQKASTTGAYAWFSRNAVWLVVAAVGLAVLAGVVFVVRHAAAPAQPASLKALLQALVSKQKGILAYIRTSAGSPNADLREAAAIAAKSQAASLQHKLKTLPATAQREAALQPALAALRANVAALKRQAAVRS
jgi:hypothetical protein